MVTVVACWHGPCGCGGLGGEAGLRLPAGQAGAAPSLASGHQEWFQCIQTGGRGVGGENEGGLRALPFGRKAKRGESETERAGSPAAGWRTGREQKAVSAEVTRRSAAEVQSHRPGLADDRARRLPRPSARPSARRVCSGPCSAGSALCPATCAGERGEGFAVTSECRNGFSVLVTQQTEYPTERVRFSGHVSAPVGVRV